MDGSAQACKPIIFTIFAPRFRERMFVQSSIHQQIKDLADIKGTTAYQFNVKSWET